MEIKCTQVQSNYKLSFYVLHPSSSQIIFSAPLLSEKVEIKGSPSTITPISACVRSGVPFTVTLLSQESCEESKLRGRSGACGVSHAARFLFVSFRHVARDALWWMQIPNAEVVKSRNAALNNFQGLACLLHTRLLRIVFKWITPLSVSQLDLCKKKEN